MKYSAANLVSEEECLIPNYDREVCAIDEYTGTCNVRLITEQFQSVLNNIY